MGGNTVLNHCIDAFRVVNRDFGAGFGTWNGFLDLPRSITLYVGLIEQHLVNKNAANRGIVMIICET